MSTQMPNSIVEHIILSISAYVIAPDGSNTNIHLPSDLELALYRHVAISMGQHYKSMGLIYCRNCKILLS